MLSSSRSESVDMSSVALDKGRKPNMWQRIRRSESARGYLFIAPWLIGFLFFALWPLLNVIYDSFTTYNLFTSPTWIGVVNYQNIFQHDPIFWSMLINMLIYVPSATLITIVGGLLLALALNRKFPGNHFFRTLFYIPSLMVGVAIGKLFKQIFASGQNGLANEFLALFHVPPLNWLGDLDHPQLAMLALVLVNLWFMGNTMLIFIAGLKGISTTYYEAAHIDGAGRWSTFWRITLPLLSPTIVFNLIWALISNLQVFDTPLVFAVAQGSVSSGGSNPLGHDNTLAVFLTYIYEKAFVELDFGYGAALAVILFVLALLLICLVFFASRFTYAGDQESSN